ncbi:MAG: hypothetical protein SFU56_15955 [Capsulimonadales bacterium]|nr:hypothetical protein [Capsulimonadales bacterium]
MTLTQTNRLTTQEWEDLRRTLEAVANAIMVAHPGGYAEEKRMIRHEWAEGPRRFPQNEFVFQLFCAMPDELRALNEQKTAHPGGGVAETIDEAVEMCRKATDLVRAKAPEEQGNFRDVVLYMANKVAGASKEGGFLGFGGKTISDAEKSVIDRLIAVLPAAP